MACGVMWAKPTYREIVGECATATGIRVSVVMGRWPAMDPVVSWRSASRREMMTNRKPFDLCWDRILRAEVHRDAAAKAWNAFRR